MKCLEEKELLGKLLAPSKHVQQLVTNALSHAPEIEREGGARSLAVATNSGSERAYVATHPANLQPSRVAKDPAIPVSIVALDPFLNVGDRVALNKSSTKQKRKQISLVRSTKQTSTALKRQNRS